MRIFWGGTKNFGKFWGGTKNFREIWGVRNFSENFGGYEKFSDMPHIHFFLLYQLELSNDIYFYQIGCIICYRILLPMGSHILSNFKIQP